MLRRRPSLLFALALAFAAGAACSSPAAVRGGATAVEPEPPSETPALDPPPPELRLPDNFELASVNAWLVIDPALDSFRGAIELNGRVKQDSARLWLHGRGLRVEQAVARQGAQSVPLTVETIGEDLLSLRPEAPLPAGAWTLALRYEGGYEPVATIGAFKQRVDDRAYVATQFESIFARRVFPCLDEPGVKVPWQLTLDVPIDQVAVANTPAVSETALDATHKRVVFAPSKPLPSYLIAFGVGPYEVIDAGQTRSGVPVRVLTFKGRTAEAAWAAQTSAKIVDVLEEWFGTPYPYPKLDMLTIPVTSGFGAMENAGLITYAQRLLLHDPSTITLAQRLTWLGVAGHEIAHQWFGDLVTASWWDDIWLNEGFARWMEPKVLAALEGQLGPALEGQLGTDLMPVGTRERALGADRLATARIVRQRIVHRGDIFSAFDRITYDKGASILHMIERHLGPDVMRQGVRAYLEAHQHGNATSRDFLSALGAAAGEDLTPMASGLLEQRGAPLVRGALRCEGGAASLTLRQERFQVPGAAASPEPSLWALPVCAVYDRDGARAEACMMLTTSSASLALPGRGCPAWVMLNASGRGYYRAGLDEASYEALRVRGWAALTPAERLVTFHDVTALVMVGELPVASVMELVPRMLAERTRAPVAAAVSLAATIKDMLPARHVPAYDRWILATFGPLARSLTWSPRRGEKLDAEVMRHDVLELVAWAGDKVLQRAAVRLAKDWRRVASSTREIVWGVAADATAALFEELLAAVVVEPSPEVRADLLRALVDVGDEARLRQVLALLFEPRLDIRETQRLLFAGRTAAQREGIALYFRQHLEPLLARLPLGGATGSGARFAAVFTRGCDAAQRDDLSAYLASVFGGLPDGARSIGESLEALDQCAAARARLVPSVLSWLSKR
ncbi:MAG: M1 family aminopeptidase [Kofleriaceae bacterium]